MGSSRRLGLLLVAPFVVVAVVAVLSPRKRPFVRIHSDALETAIATYRSSGGAKGATVTLVGAVHVAERAYYETLQRDLDDHDVVLVEGVVGIGSHTRARESYAAIASACALVRQTDATCWRKSFVPADLTWDEWSQLVGDETTRATQARLDSANEVERLSPERRRLLRRVIAERVLEPAERALIVPRNRRCMEVLDDVLRKSTSKPIAVAILYGTGHLPDFDERLRARGFRLEKLEWRTAFALPTR